MTDEARPALEVAAYAKVNLSLDIVGWSPQYHQLRSVMQTVSLCDTLTLRTSNGAGAQIRELPAEFFLIDQALAAVSGDSPSGATLTYKLEKRIPVAAGLGGGSSDCAAALRGGTRLLSLPEGPDALRDIAIGLGSDVPFFLAGGTALVEGRGESVSLLGDAPQRWFLLANHGGEVSTAAVFAELRPDEFGEGEASERTLAGLERGDVKFGGNDLTPPAIRRYPEIAHTFEVMRSVVPLHRMALSGSGGTVVALFDGKAEAGRAREKVAAKMGFTAVVRTVSRREALTLVTVKS